MECMMPRWTIKQAAEECGVHPDTIRRRLAQLQEHGAEKDEIGAWIFTPQVLMAAGFHPGKPSPPDPEPEQVPNASTTRTDQAHYGSAVPQNAASVMQPDPLTHRVHELETALALEKVRREAAEQLAAERAKALDRADLALRALEAPARWTVQQTAGEQTPFAVQTSAPFEVQGASVEEPEGKPSRTARAVRWLLLGL